MGILYNLRRINEVCKEHTENNFLPLPPRYTTQYELIRTQISTLFNDTLELMKTGDTDAITALRQHCDEIKDIMLTNSSGMVIRQQSLCYMYM